MICLGIKQAGKQSLPYHLHTRLYPGLVLHGLIVAFRGNTQDKHWGTYERKYVLKDDGERLNKGEQKEAAAAHSKTVYTSNLAAHIQQKYPQLINDALKYITL